MSLFYSFYLKSQAIEAAREISLHRHLRVYVLYDESVDKFFITDNPERNSSDDLVTIYYDGYPNL